jgi:hypothetical protein
MGNGTSKQFEGKERKSGGGGGGLESSLLSCQCVYHDPALRMRHTIHILNSCIGPYNLTLGSLWLLIYLCMAVVLEKKKKSIPFGLGVQLTTPEQS